MQVEKYVLVTVLLILGLVIAPAGAQAIPVSDLITNGGFEIGENPPDSGQTPLGTGATDIEGWTVTAGSVDWTADYWDPQAGSRSLDLSGGSYGVISTTINTIPGVTYLVTFYMSGNFEGGNSTKRLKVSAGDESETFYFAEPTYWSTENMYWTKQTFTFTADDYSTQLIFSSLDNNAFGPAMDSVTLEVVPLPSAALLLGSGLLGLLGWRRKTKT